MPQQPMQRQVRELHVSLDRAAEELRQSEEQFRLLVESVQDYAIFMLDLEGHVASWNPGAERIEGYRAEEILGRHFSIFYPPKMSTAEYLMRNCARRFLALGL